MDFILVPSAFHDHPITICNLTDIDVIDLFAAVLLADPPRRAVVLNSHVSMGIDFPDGQGGFVWIAAYDIPLQSGLPTFLLHFLLSGR